MTDAVITFDAEGKVILTNPQGQKIVDDWSGIQWSNDEDEMKTVPSLTVIRQIPEPLKPLFDLVVCDAQEHTSNLHVMDGVWSVVMAPLYSSGVVRGAVAVLRDVTEAFRLDKLRKDFVANVSHELRTPLSMLQGYSEALLDDIAGTPEERKELAQVIYDESLRMGRLVKDLLDLARMEAGHMQLNLREVSVNAFVQRVYRKFSAMAKERGLAISCSVPETDIVLDQADEDRLEQVLTNLLDNAIRHTPKQSGISIRAEAVRRGNEQDVLIEIKDHGQGIPAEDLPYIFERFYKADKARTRDSTGGTGLGLAIVKNIVEAHGGKIHVASTVGQGTTFSIILPANPRQNGKSR
jgi:two-component system sensor histidine kinase ResE